MIMEKLISLALSAALVLSPAAFGEAGQDDASKNHIPNPFVDCDTLRDAGDIAGFPIDTPETISGYKQPIFRAVEKNMIEVIYTAQEGDGELRIRKGTGNEDISGDYEKYDETETVTMNEREVTMKGNSGKVHTAVWTEGGYSYAVLSLKGMEKVVATDLIEFIDSAPLIGGDSSTWGPAENGDVQIPNPFVDYNTLADAAAVTGFDLTVPDTIQGYEERVIQVMGESMIQVLYSNQDNNVCIRKAAGNEDISGDYTEYSHIQTVDVDGRNVTMKGNDGKIMVAIWDSNGYTYVVGSSAGMDSENMTTIIQAVK